MGNKQAQQHCPDYVQQYSHLINMGFASNASLFAAQKHPKNINKALNLLSNNNTEHPDDMKMSRSSSSQNPDELRSPTGELSHCSSIRKMAFVMTMNHLYPHNFDDKLRLQPFIDICESIERCDSINRIIQYLNMYQIMQSDDIIKTFGDNDKYPHLTNDFNHVLVQHLGDNKTVDGSQEEFGKIYEYIMSKIKVCKLEKCEKFARNNRNREKEIDCKIDLEKQYYIDIMDTMHCFFMHSLDVGHRMDTKYKLDNDLEMKHLYSVLQTTRNRLDRIDGVDRYKSSKFVTSINNSKQSDENKKRKRWTLKHKKRKSNKNDKDKEDKKEEDVEMKIYSGSYSFGYKYNYWDKFMNDEKYVGAKYDNLSDEITHNKICVLPKCIFYLIRNKAKEKMKSVEARRTKAGFTEYFHSWIDEGVAISVEHIMAILFYTDFDEISTCFSSTFRSLNGTDNFEEAKRRNMEFAIWSKLLVEAVNIFGTDIGKSSIQVYYHGVNALFICSSLVTEFNAPTSTTIQLSVAASFAKDTGAIMELEAQRSDLRCFNCSWLSKYASEDERLFCTPPLNDFYQLKFTNIRSIEDGVDYGKYISALRTLEYAVSGDDHVAGRGLSAENQVIVVKNMINHHDEIRKYKNKYPLYANRMFDALVKDKTEIVIHGTASMNDYVRPLFFDTSGVLKIYDICIIFPNCDTIRARITKWKFTKLHFDAILGQLKALQFNNKQQLKSLVLAQIDHKKECLELYRSKFDALGWIIKTHVSDITFSSTTQ